MKTSDIRKKSAEEMIKQALELRQKIVEKSKAKVIGESNDHNEIAKLKKDLARVLTVLTEVESKEAQNV